MPPLRLQRRLARSYFSLSARTAASSAASSRSCASSSSSSAAAAAPATATAAAAAGWCGAEASGLRPESTAAARLAGCASAGAFRLGPSGVGGSCGLGASALLSGGPTPAPSPFLAMTRVISRNRASTFDSNFPVSAESNANCARYSSPPRERPTGPPQLAGLRQRGSIGTGMSAPARFRCAKPNSILQLSLGLFPPTLSMSARGMEGNGQSSLGTRAALSQSPHISA